MPESAGGLPTLRVALDRFLARSRFATRTRESYAQDLAPLLARVGDHSITALTRERAVAFLAAQEHLAAATFNRRHAALGSLVRWCLVQGWLADDPLAGLERRPQPRRAPRALDPAQVETTLRVIRDVRDRALFWLIYEGGVRCSEALAIDIEEINWGNAPCASTAKGAESGTCSSPAAWPSCWMTT